MTSKSSVKESLEKTLEMLTPAHLESSSPTKLKKIKK
jgi:hypothetical protein